MTPVNASERTHGQEVSEKVAVSVVYVAAMFMAIMDTTIVNVALPALGRDLHARAGSVGLVPIAYLVSLTVFIPASGWLGDRIGGRRALLGAVGVFTIASGLCGLSSSLGELVAFRVLQGIGGAVMTPVGLAMPPSRRPGVATATRRWPSRRPCPRISSAPRPFSPAACPSSFQPVTHPSRRARPPERPPPR